MASDSERGRSNPSDPLVKAPNMLKKIKEKKI